MCRGGRLVFEEPRGGELPGTEQFGKRQAVSQPSNGRCANRMEHGNVMVLRVKLPDRKRPGAKVKFDFAVKVRCGFGGRNHLDGKLRRTYKVIGIRGVPSALIAKNGHVRLQPSGWIGSKFVA